MLERLLALVGATAVLAAAPVAASASDASSTETYLRANYSLVKAGQAHLGASIAAYKSVLATVKRDCPRAAVESPQNPESTELSNEVIGTMVLRAGQPDRPAVKSYLRAVAGLRWSSASVTHAVAGYASMLRTLYNLPVPDLCGDVKAWATSHFKSTSAGTVSFVKAFYPNWVALGLIPAGLSRFESSQGRTLARNSGRFEYQITNVEAQAVETWGDIMNELVLNP
jgi:hypothetical protein